jgi:hypothetical protein
MPGEKNPASIPFSSKCRDTHVALQFEREEKTGLSGKGILQDYV